MFKSALLTTAALGVAALMTATSASAHNYMTTLRAPAGYVADMEARVAHGCLAEDVREVRVKIPEGVFRVTPMNSRDWEIEVKMREVNPPVAGDGGRPITSTVDQIIWKNPTAAIPYNRLEGFKFRAKLPNEPGRILFWQMVNICAEGRDPYTDLPETALDVKDPDFVEKFEAFMSSTAHPAPYTVLYKPEMPQYPWEWSAEDMQLTGMTQAVQTAEAK
jgi:uncharacterized protein YcnI